jgi:DUF4097 and DUF4098 domain-containing protein YvlB
LVFRRSKQRWPIRSAASGLNKNLLAEPVSVQVAPGRGIGSREIKIYNSSLKFQIMRIILSFLFVFSGILVQAQDSHKGLLYFNKSLTADAINQVDARTSGGGIEVTGVSPSEARIEVYVTENGHHGSYSKEEIQKMIDKEYEFSVTTSGNKLTAIAKQKRNFNNWNNSLSFSYSIYVPVACATHLNTSGGGISISNLTGEQHFNTSGGGLDVKGLTGKIVGQTSGGGITVSDSKDDIDLETSGGGIEARHCSGQIRLNTSGGSIDLNDLNGNIRATTSGGNVDAEKITGELVTHTSGGNMSMTGMMGSLEASTSGGNIEVEILETGKYVKLRNSGGSVRLQVPKGKGLDLDIHGDRIKTEGLSNFSGSLEKQSISGTVNGGGVPIDINAGSGGVTLALK